MVDAPTQDVVNPGDPVRMDPAATDAWRVSTSPGVADLVPGDDSSMSGLVSSLTDLRRKKVSSDLQIEGEANAQAARDKQIRDRMFAAEGVAANEFPPKWNAEEEHKKFESSPIEAFGSAGGLFAMVASAFTRRPMETAINGMASAINSIKEGNEKGYERAFGAFKENVKLAETRFKNQHELYQDALSLSSADAAASAAKFHNAAVRFGDQQMLVLAEHGMIKEIYELQESRAKAMEQAAKMAESMDLHTVQKAAVDAVKKGFQPSGDPVMDKVQIAAQIQRIYDGNQKYGSAEQEAVGRFVMEAQQKHLTWQETADGLADIHQKFSAKAPNIQGYQDARDAEIAANGSITPERDSQLLQQFGLSNVRGTGAANSQSSQARKTRAIEEIQKKHADEGKPISIAEAEKEYNKTVQVPSAHDVHQDDVQYAKAERMERAMDEMEQLMLKHKLITGLGGTVTRPFEAIANVLGSNETDRKQFQRVATELKEWGQSVVNDRTGRPLSQEARDAAVIFAGLNPGDTGPNTIRAIVELRPVIAQIKKDIFARGQGKGPVSGGGTSPPAETEGSKKPLWQSAPVAE